MLVFGCLRHRLLNLMLNYATTLIEHWFRSSKDWFESLTSFYFEIREFRKKLVRIVPSFVHL